MNSIEQSELETLFKFGANVTIVDVRKKPALEKEPAMIQGAGGRIDKFIGDGIMALFGTEGGAENNAQQTLTAAREMSLSLELINERLKNDLNEPLHLGIGIHRGSAIVGTMGHGAATQITAIGDTVNTAARLESITKHFGIQLLVSSAVEAEATADLSGFE